jgi:hypothetical protein
MTSRYARFALIAAQVVAIGAATWFLITIAREAWPSLARFRIAPAPLPLILASLLTAATYFFLIRTWAGSLRWWGESQQLPYRDAIRIWFLTNLARFIPGTIWQFAGLGVMASRRGISPIAATGTVLLQQVVLLATGVLLTVGLAPQLLGSWTAALPHAALIGIAAFGAALFVWGLPRATGWLQPLMFRMLKREVVWLMPPVPQLAMYVAGLILPWIVYGIAFWLFGRSLLGDSGGGPGLLLSIAAFTASYVAGIIAVFAPGGIVVREAALVAALSPQMGPDRAFLLAVGSRVWLVAVELVTALVALAVVSRRS